MKRVFVSIPMRGRSRDSIREESERLLTLAAAELKDDVVWVRNCWAGKWDSPLWSLGESLKRMSTADYVVFAQGWHGSSGCQIEHQCALLYGIAILDWVDLEEAYGDV